MTKPSINTPGELLLDDEAQDRLVRFFDVLIEMDFEYERKSHREADGAL